MTELESTLLCLLSVSQETATAKEVPRGLQMQRLLGIPKGQSERQGREYQMQTQLLAASC